MTDVAQCACLRVEYKTTQHDNGTVTGRWLCAYGGDHEFVPIAQLRAALARAERAEARMDALRGWLVDHECKNDRCPFCRTLDLIAELEKP